MALHGSHLHCHRMDLARTASFPHSNIGNVRSIHWTVNGWCTSLQYGRHASTETNPPHHTITTASPAGHPIHPSCGCASESYLCLQDQYPLGCLFLLLRSSEDICLHSKERRTTSSSSGSSKPQDQYQRLHLKSQHRRGPERSLTISDTPVEVVPKDPTLYPSLGWI